MLWCGVVVPARPTGAVREKTAFCSGPGSPRPRGSRHMSRPAFCRVFQTGPCRLRPGPWRSRRPSSRASELAAAGKSRASPAGMSAPCGWQIRQVEGADGLSAGGGRKGRVVFVRLIQDEAREARAVGDQGVRRAARRVAGAHVAPLALILPGFSALRRRDVSQPRKCRSDYTVVGLALQGSVG